MITEIYTKTIILVRHGQYLAKDENQPERLTELGRQQAWLAGERLKEIYHIDRITHSTMPRAIETAQIIKEQLGFLGPFESCDEIRECVPRCKSIHMKKFGYTVENTNAASAQLERAYKKHFKMPKRNSIEVLVCHGNVTRFLVCRTLGLDETTWTSLDISQGSLSTIELRSSGVERKVLISHNDVGHIPKEKRTFL